MRAPNEPLAFHAWKEIKRKQKGVVQDKWWFYKEYGKYTDKMRKENKQHD